MIGLRWIDRCSRVRASAEIPSGRRPGFEISTRTEYAGVHQYGAKIAPHTRLNRALVFDRHGKFVSTRTKAGRAKIVSAWMGHATYGNGITITRRQMVPEADTGGVGALWGDAMNKAAEAVVTAHFAAVK